MKKQYLFFAVLFSCAPLSFGQYQFSGEIDPQLWEGELYLSLVEDYRKMNGVHPEQIINTAKPDSLGRFTFQGNNLSSDNRIYRIHVDNCAPEIQGRTHFTGHCTNSKEILFIAKNTDSIALPFSFDQQMFCKVNSNNEQASAFIKMDSLMEQMRFDFGTYRSEASRNLNSKKWFTTFQSFGLHLNEPLAELYAYQFFSDRTNDLYPYYLEDLAANNHYDQLLRRLEITYPNSFYTKQYRRELETDKFYISKNTVPTSSNWMYGILGALIISILANIYFYRRLQKKQEVSLKNQRELLTQQEQNILDLILQNKTNKEIAAQMFISLSTVKTHINNIYKKLEVNTRTDVLRLFKGA